MLRLFLVLSLLTVSEMTRAESINQWGRWQGTFTAAGSDSESAMTVGLTSPSGKSVAVAGFWDGGNTWRARFMPDEPGKWRYVTHSADSGLNGKSGEFDCKKAKSKLKIYQNGSIRVSQNGRYLMHADSTPFFWLGDTAWSGPQLSAKADWEEYLKDRAAKGFTVIQFVLAAPWRTTPADELGQTAFTRSDSGIRINPKFFQRMDQRVDAINDKGLIAAAVLLWAIRGEENPGHSLPEDQVIKLEKYMVARYAAHHVVWIPGGDADYSGANGEKWKRIGRAVFGSNSVAENGQDPKSKIQSPKSPPVVLHPGGMQWPWDAFKEEKWLDILGYQSGHGDDGPTLAWMHSGPPSKKWREEPARPVINLEPPYEGHLAYQSRKPHSDYSVRRAAYWSLFSAPMAGLTYGAHGVWSWQTTVGEPPAHKGTGEARTWRDAMNLPGSAQMGYLAKVLGALPWWALKPAQEMLAKQPGGEDPAKFVAAAQTEGGIISVLYLPVGGEIDLKAATFQNSYRAFWVDPRTGKQVRAYTSSVNAFKAPSQEDWLLVIGQW